MHLVLLLQISQRQMKIYQKVHLRIQMLCLALLVLQIWPYVVKRFENAPKDERECPLSKVHECHMKSELVYQNNLKETT